jgi:hypothetical protein
MSMSVLYLMWYWICLNQVVEAPKKFDLKEGIPYRLPDGDSTGVFNLAAMLVIFLTGNEMRAIKRPREGMAIGLCVLRT